MDQDGRQNAPSIQLNPIAYVDAKELAGRQPRRLYLSAEFRVGFSHKLRRVIAQANYFGCGW